MILVLYCSVCYLIVFGILSNEYDHLEEWQWKDIIALTLAPFIVPVLIGMHLNKKEGDEE